MKNGTMKRLQLICPTKEATILWRPITDQVDYLLGEEGVEMID